VAELFYEIHRLLKHNGVYVLCSLHPPSLILPFLSLPSLQFNVEFCREVKMEEGECFGTIALCRKINNGRISFDNFRVEEKELMDMHYQGIDPWLTTDMEALIRSACPPSSVPMPLQDANRLINKIDPSLGYDYDLFLSDINNFSLSYEHAITVDELLSFLKSMQ
jgi:hypothetical protein